MEKYNYYEAVKNDVMDYIEENINFKDYEDINELEQHLNDELFSNDSVTGNASGSYTFSTWEAEENLCHNLDLLQEALEEFGCNVDYLKKGIEACDVTIRCYVLGSCISEAIEDIRDDFNAAHEESEKDQ